MSDPEAGPSHSPQRPQRGMMHSGGEAVFEGAEALDPALMADDSAGGYSYGGSVTAPGTGTGTGTGAGSTGGSASGSGSHTGNGTENGQSRSHTQSPAAGHYQYPYPGEQGNIMGANVSPSAQSAQDGTSHPPGSAHSQGQASASGSGAGAVGQEGQISVMGEDGLMKRVGGKANVSSACGPCKRAHLACDIGRPCKRCVNLGKEAQCEDVPVRLPLGILQLDHLADAQCIDALKSVQVATWHMLRHWISETLPSRQNSTLMFAA